MSEIIFRQKYVTAISETDKNQIFDLQHHKWTFYRT